MFIDLVFDRLPDQLDGCPLFGQFGDPLFCIPV